MVTKNSLLGTHGIDRDVAIELGDRFDVMTLWEKTSFLETISGWLSQCACHDEANWSSFHEFTEMYGDMDPAAFPMIKQHFDYCEPQAILPLMLALVYQIQEEVYAPGDEGEDD